MRIMFAMAFSALALTTVILLYVMAILPSRHRVVPLRFTAGLPRRRNEDIVQDRVVDVLNVHGLEAVAVDARHALQHRLHLQPEIAMATPFAIARQVSSSRQRHQRELLCSGPNAHPLTQILNHLI